MGQKVAINDRETINDPENLREEMAIAVFPRR